MNYSMMSFKPSEKSSFILTGVYFNIYDRRKN